MKKIILFLCCLSMLLTMAIPVLASDIDATDETGISDETSASTETTTHVHSWTITSDTATCTTEGTITKICSCEETQTEASPAKNHSWGSGSVTTAASCLTDGVTTFTCTRPQCTEKKTETIPKTGHVYGDWTKDENGHSRACSVCLVTDSGSHSWKEETVKKPTCAEAGSKKKSCTICDYNEVIVLPQLTTHTYDSACDPECNVCGITREIEHAFTKTWSKDHKGHWYECTKCGEQKNYSKHTPGPKATERNDQVCTICDYVIEPQKEHVHNYGREWSSDKVGHWHACTGCDKELEYASHVYDDACDSDCNTCGYKRENTHTYETAAWQSNQFEHWNICTICGEESKREKHIPGEAATEEAPQLCSVCAFELAPILEHTHDFGNRWYLDDENHWQECTCGEQSVPAPHIWDAGKENRNGTITYACVSCEAEKTEAAPASGFNWILIPLIILALGCLGGIAFLVWKLKTGTFDDEDDVEDHIQEEPVFQKQSQKDVPAKKQMPLHTPAAAASLEYDPFEDDLDEINALLGLKPDVPSQEDLEQQMIDDYFASLDK